MEQRMNLSPQVADTAVIEVEGGAYYVWSEPKFPLLGKTKLGAGKLVLNPRGFALPHFADCNKIGFVVQGSCRVGIVMPNKTTEQVLTIKKGDAIPVYLGAISWWYNNLENSRVEIIFLGETNNTYTPAQFDYFFLTRAMGVLRGFSSDFISQALHLSQNESDKLVNSQTNAMIVTLPEGKTLPEPSNEAYNKMAFELGTLTGDDFHPIEGFELSAKHVKLEGNSMLGPIVTGNSLWAQAFYVFEGRGRVQVSGIGGNNVLDAKLKKGELLLVPGSFAVAIMADEEGLQCFSVLKSSKSSFVEFAGERSVWKALSPLTLEASLNVDFVQILK